MSPTSRKIATVAAVFFLLGALALGLASMFYVGWVKYTVNPPVTPSDKFKEGQASKFYYHTRFRGLFYFAIEDENAQVVKENGDKTYFPVMYNYNASLPSPTVGFWSLTVLMKASVGLHVGYLACIALAAWLITFSCCLGRKLSYLSAALIIIAVIAGGIGLALFHIYLGMEKSDDIKALSDIWHNWPKELQVATGETFYLSYGLHIGSFGASLLGFLIILFMATSWEGKDKKAEHAMSDKVQIYEHDNSAYDHNDGYMDKPARAELWNGFDRLSDKRTMERLNGQKMRAHYEYGAGSGHKNHGGGLYGNGIGRQHTIERSEMAGMSGMVTPPTRQHYHSDATNYPIRY